MEIRSDQVTCRARRGSTRSLVGGARRRRRGRGRGASGGRSVTGMPVDRHVRRRSRSVLVCTRCRVDGGCTPRGIDSSGAPRPKPGIPCERGRGEVRGTRRRRPGAQQDRREQSLTPRSSGGPTSRYTPWSAVSQRPLATRAAACWRVPPASPNVVEGHQPVLADEHRQQPVVERGHLVLRGRRQSVRGNGRRPYDGSCDSGRSRRPPATCVLKRSTRRACLRGTKVAGCGNRIDRAVKSTG